jgi:cytochrome bd ubiquinol oxidase subunit II
VHRDPDFLQSLWFVLIGVLWIGYFVLEGFDFGVGMLVHGLGRDRTERRLLIHTIGPVWDGNEVWLLVAGGATFAAFPGWYSTAFSGFYLALFLVLASLIVRGVSFEFWGKVDSDRWRAGWEWALAISSGAAALLFGVAWANFVHGVPMGAGHVVHASLLDLLHPYALLGGLTTLSLFAAHGAGFLTLRTRDELRDRAAALGARLTVPAAILSLAFVAWTIAAQGSARVTILGALALVAILSVPLAQRRSSAAGFVSSTLAIVLLTVVLLAGLFPEAVRSTSSPAFDLSLRAASSSSYTLTVMTVVTVLFLPIVLSYQAWTYWVFRHRLGRDDYDGPLTPIAVLQDRHPEASQTDPTAPPSGIA